MGLDGVDVVYPLLSGVVGRRLCVSEYTELLPGLLLRVFILVAESDCLTERPALDNVGGRRWWAFRIYEWSWNLPDPNRLLLIRLLFADDSDATDGEPCKAELVVVVDLTDCPPTSDGDAEILEARS